MPVEGRIELVIQVCQGIQHAHNKGVIHRDIKPSNVLITVYDGKPVPKVIDFGIAKSLEDDDSTDITRVGTMVGTLDYMSPEQTAAADQGLDTRSDIYSLGALLYRLVCGTTPLSLNRQLMSYGEMLRRIREDTPAPASRVTGNRALRELDWILAKALEKDRERRYQSADAMASDLRRFLDGEPLEAGPPSAAYRLRKVAAKFKYWVAAAAAVMVLLLAGSIAMAFALRQQSRANASAAALRDVVRRIIIDRPGQLATIPNRTALRGELMRDAESALDALSRDPSKDPALQLELARAYLSIGLAKGPYSAEGSEGDPAGAALYVAKSVDLYSSLAKQKPNDPVIRRGQLEAQSTRLHLLYRLNKQEEGQKAAHELETEIAGMSPQLREETQARWYLSTAYTELGLLLFSQSKDQEGLAAHRKAASLFEGGIPAEWTKDPEKLSHLSRLWRELSVSMWMAEGYTPATETMARAAVDAVHGCDAPNCRMRHAQSEGTLGEIEWAGGKKDQGSATLRASLAEFESLAADDPNNAVFQNAAAQVRCYLALTLAGGPFREEAVTLAGKSSRVAAGADAGLHRARERLMVRQITLGAALLGAGRLDEGVRQLRETLDRNRDWDVNWDLVWSALHLLAVTFEKTGNYQEELTVAKEETKYVLQDPSNNLRIMAVITMRDYAAAVAHWKDATPNDRAKALQGLETSNGLDARYAGLTGALLERPPTAADLTEIRALLRRTE